VTNDRKKLLLISLGHFTVDGYAGFFPMYMAMKDLDLVKAVLIVTVGNMVSNFLQPFFGLMADRFRKEWILFISMAMGPLFMSLIGATDNITKLAFLVISAKIMISLFHPAATDLATETATGERSPLRFSLFSFIGTVSFAFTGLYFHAFCSRFGFGNSVFMAMPALVAAFIVKTTMPVIPHGRKANFVDGIKKALWNKKKAILILYFLVVIQSSVQIVLVYSLPTLYKEWGFAEKLWAIPHLVFTFSGACSVIAAGLLAKKIPSGKLIVCSMALDIPLWYLFLHFGSNANYLSFVWLALLGLTNFAAFPAIVVLGQKKLPEFGATISGILMGAAWGLAGLSPLLISLFSEWSPIKFEGARLMPGLILIGILPIIAIIIWISTGGERGLERRSVK
jgi:FSR family fosmidomycin resistance protein-like MFS transporter